MNMINIEIASVKVMRSHDYCHFEVSLSSSLHGLEDGPATVDKLRKQAARLADKAVEQYKIAKRASEVRETMKKHPYALERAQKMSEEERTPTDKALIKYHADAAFAAQFDYDYEDDWEEPNYDGNV